MRSFQEKKNWRKIMESKPFLVFFGALILIFAWSVFGLAQKMRETIRNKEEAQGKITELEQAKAKLTADISKLNTVEGKEESIREKFGWAKEGERVIVVVDDKSTAEAGGVAEDSGFFFFFKNLFK